MGGHADESLYRGTIGSGRRPALKHLGNATEHMNEAVTSIKSALGNSNPNLYAQFVLYDYRKALIAATRGGIQYGRMVKSGHWTFKFSRSRNTDIYPVVARALFTGLS